MTVCGEIGMAFADASMKTAEKIHTAGKPPNTL
jgi:hypothetical protein